MSYPPQVPEAARMAIQQATGIPADLIGSFIVDADSDGFVIRVQLTPASLTDDQAEMILSQQSRVYDQDQFRDEFF